MKSLSAVYNVYAVLKQLKKIHINEYAMQKCTLSKFQLCNHFKFKMLSMTKRMKIRLNTTNNYRQQLCYTFQIWVFKILGGINICFTMKIKISSKPDFFTLWFGLNIKRVIRIFWLIIYNERVKQDSHQPITLVDLFYVSHNITWKCQCRWKNCYIFTDKVGNYT